MAGNDSNIIGNDWENGLIREALIELGDEEALRLFDKEQEEMRLKAEAEIQEMIDKGEYIAEDK